MKKLLEKFKKEYLLVGIILLGTTLRFVGTNPGYNPYNADENMSYSSAWNMVLNHNLDPQRYDYPALIPIINLVFYLLFFIPLYWMKYIMEHPEILHSFNTILSLFPGSVVPKGDVQAMFWSRYITALFGSFILILVYIVSLKVYKSKLVGLFATILVAVNYREVLNSHFGLPDIYNGFFFLLSLYLTLRLLDKPNLRSYLLAGLGIAFSFSTKFQIFTLLPFLIVHIYISVCSNKWLYNRLKNILSVKLILSLILIPLVFLLLNPYLIEHFQKFIEVNRYTLLKYAAQMSPLYGYSYLFYVALTPLVCVLVVAGIVISFKRSIFASLLLVSIPLTFLYSLFYKIGGTSYVRNYVSIIPILLIFGGLTLETIYSFFRKITQHVFVSRLLLGMLITLVSINPLRDSLIVDRSYQNPWEMTQLNKEISTFINTKVSSSETKPKLASHPWDFMEVLSKPEFLSDKFDQTTLNLDNEYDVSELRNEGANYALIGLDVIDVANTWWIPKMEHVGFAFWGNRANYLRNEFQSLAVNELTQYTVFSEVKPWQAPENNYVFVKIPPPPYFKATPLSEIHFDKPTDYPDWNHQIVFDPHVGHLNNGSVQIIDTNSPLQITRFVSQPIQVKPNYGYTAEAWIKTKDVLEKKNRDGFLRVDFYKDKIQKLDDTTIGDETFLSERYYGNGDWKKLSVISIAPPESRYITVSFQVSDPKATTFWLDDISIYQSDMSVKIQTTPYQIPGEVLYPYSPGNL